MGDVLHPHSLKLVTDTCQDSRFISLKIENGVVLAAFGHVFGKEGNNVSLLFPTLLPKSDIRQQMICINTDRQTHTHTEIQFTIRCPSMCVFVCVCVH